MKPVLYIAMLLTLACASSHAEEWPAGIDPNRPLVSLTHEEEQRLCDFRADAYWAAGGRQPGEAFCDRAPGLPPEPVPERGDWLCMISQFESQLCPRTVSDFVRCMQQGYTELAAHNWSCEVVVDMDCTMLDPICFVCEEDLDCQRCNADGCHFPERVCDLPGEDGTRACVSPATTCHEDDDCRCTPEGDCRWPEAYCEPYENQSFGSCVYP